MTKKLSKTQKIGIMAMFVSVGLVLQYAESRIIITSVPGGKLGLANVVSIINIFMFGGKNALLIASLRAILGCLLSGGISALPYSLSGAVFSTVLMWIMRKWLYPRVSMIGLSIAGASIHNIAQLMVASAIFSSVYVFSYLPVLLVLSVFSGMATGYTAEVLSKRILVEDKK